MIYLVTKQLELFDNDVYKIISVEESLRLLDTFNMVQYDSETLGLDQHIGKVLCIQFGNKEQDIQIVVDASTIDIKVYKTILENKYIVGQNLKFDIQWLYNYGIVPRKIYDTMIVEQLIHLGWPKGTVSYSLDSIAYDRLGVVIDKSARGEIIWRGLDTKTIKYAANDVVYLEDIMKSQLKECKEKDLLRAAKIECDFVPVVSYLEWCGIMLDKDKWSEKMQKDRESLNAAEKLLNDFVIKTPSLKQYVHINTQGDLWEGFDLTPKCNINWSGREVINILKILGFNTVTQDKETGEDKDSALEKLLKPQKGINDEFLELYFKYQEYSKVVSSFGQGHLNAINPNTGRIHTVYRQLGCKSGRMSCGSDQPNKDLAKLNKVSEKDCKYPNMQQLPADDKTRSCFVAPEGHLWASCDYSALESRLGADIYNEESMLKEFLEGSGDMHSLCAYMCYPEIPRDTPIKDIKKLYPKQRKEVKGVEFSQQFGGSEYAIMGAMGCSMEEALKFKHAYEKGFPGIASFKSKGSKFVREHGYILMCEYSGHKMYWWDHARWLETQKSFTKEFWEEYRNNHKGTGDYIAQEVSKHFKIASKWDRYALNSVTQGSGSVILKIAMIDFFDWIISNDYFDKVHIVALVHDEANITYPKELEETPNILQKCMEDAAAVVCKKLPIPAEVEIGDHWIH